MNELQSQAVLGGMGSRTWGALRKPRVRVLISATAAMVFLLLARWWVVGSHSAERREELRGLLVSVLETTRDSVRSWGATTRAQAIWRAEKPRLRTLVARLSSVPRTRDSLIRTAAGGELAELLQDADGPWQGGREALGNFVIVAPDGIVLASWDEGLVGTHLPLEKESAWAAALRGGTELLPAWPIGGAPSPAGALQSNSEMVVAAPIRSSTGDVIAALGFRLKAATELEQLVRPGQFGRTGRTHVFSKDQRWLTFDSGRSQASATAEVLSPYLVKAGIPDSRSFPNDPGASATGVEVLGYPGRFGNQVVGAWCLVPELGIGLATEMDFEEAFLPLRQLRRAMVSFNVVAVLLVIGLVAASRRYGQDVALQGVYHRRHSLTPWATLAVSLIATGLLWHSTQKRVHEFDLARFNREVDRFRQRLVASLKQQAEALRSVQAAYEAFPNLSHGQWKQFVGSLRLPEALSAEYIAFVERVPAHRLVAHEAAARRDLPAPYRIQPRGERADYLPIRHIEPFSQNAERLGFDIGSIPILRQQAELSSESGKLTRQHLQQRRISADQRAGILSLIPIYRRGADLRNADQRRMASRGWVAALVSPEPIFRQISGEGEAGIDLEVFAGSELNPESLIYDGDGIIDSGRGPHRGPFHRVTSIDAGETVWSLSFAADNTFGASSWDDQSAQVLLGGLAISILLFDMTLVLSSTRSSALAMADLLTRRVRESEARIRAVIDQAPDGIITFDPQGLMETFNPGAERLFGYSAEEVQGCSISKLMPACAGEQGCLPLSKAEHGPKKRLAVGQEVQGKKKDGTEFPVELTISQLEIEGRLMFTAIVRDISERKSAEEALRESEQRYALAARAVNDGLWDWNLTSDEIYYSPRWKAGLGYDDDELENRPDEWLNRVHEDDRPVVFSALRRHLEARSPQFECEYRIRHRDGAFRWMLSRGVAVLNENQKPIRLAGSQTDITARKHAENRLLHEALHDPLTGLPNRAYFMTRLESAAEKAAEREKKLFAVLFLDVDRFKVVNDSLGHAVGDELLVAIAQRLKTLLRPNDTIARLGGDEFAVLLENLSSESEAPQIAERLHKGLSEPFAVGDQEVFANASIGIAFSGGHDETPVDLLRNADTAMYRAKSLGKACYETFDQRMHQHAVELLQLETSLRKALEREEFCIHYQPIVCLETGRITACEALLRWQHPERGMVLPGEFIPVSEETGLIIPMSEWVLERTCRQVKAWEEEGLGRIPVSVNVSPRQLKSTDLFETVTKVLTETQLDPGLLKLELTESGLMGNADSAVKTLFRLYAKGIEISLDDFGTGYSSLTYLRRFPISCLKIDKSFVSEIATDPGDAAIACGVITLAHSLDLVVIFEGVETVEQLEFLRRKGCDQVQGRVLCPPLEEHAYAALLRERKTGAGGIDDWLLDDRSSLVALGNATAKPILQRP